MCIFTTAGPANGSFIYISLLHQKQILIPNYFVNIFFDHPNKILIAHIYTS